MKMSFMPGNHSHITTLYNNLLEEAHRLEETPEDHQIQTTPGETICSVVDNHHRDLKDHQGRRMDLHGDNLLKDHLRDLHGDNHHQDPKDHDQQNAGFPLQVGLPELTAA